MTSCQWWRFNYAEGFAEVGLFLSLSPRDQLLAALVRLLPLGMLPENSGPMYPRSATSPLTFFDIVRAVATYRARALLVATLGFVILSAIIFMLPRRYESEAKLFVRLGRSSASMDPATIGATISIQESRETEMNSILDLLQSRGLADRVVEEIGVDRLLKKNAWIERFTDGLMDSVRGRLIPKSETPALAEAGVGVTELQEIAVEELMGNLHVSSPKKSTTLAVVYRARDPQLAYEVVQSVVENYRAMHVATTLSVGAFPFFDEQFQEQQSILTAAEQRLSEVKDQAAMLSLDGKRQSLQLEQDSIRQLLIQTQADQAAALSRVASLEKTMQALPREFESERISGIESGASDSMRDRLYELEIREQELAARFKEGHPELKKVRTQLAEAKGILELQPSERQHKVVSVNPVMVEMEKEWLVAKANVASLNEKLKAVSEMEMANSLRIRKLNELELEAEALQRKIDIAKENHANYARKREESRINAELDRQSMSNVSVVTPPTVRWKAVSPKRSLLVVVAGLFSLLAGIFTALLSDFASRLRISGPSPEPRNPRPAGPPQIETGLEEELIVSESPNVEVHAVRQSLPR